MAICLNKSKLKKQIVHFYMFNLILNTVMTSTLTSAVGVPRQFYEQAGNCLKFLNRKLRENIVIIQAMNENVLYHLMKKCSSDFDSHFTSCRSSFVYRVVT